MEREGAKTHLLQHYIQPIRAFKGDISAETVRDIRPPSWLISNIIQNVIIFVYHQTGLIGEIWIRLSRKIKEQVFEDEEEKKQD